MRRAALPSPIQDAAMRTVAGQPALVTGAFHPIGRSLTVRMQARMRGPQTGGIAGSALAASDARWIPADALRLDGGAKL
jgi:hypothetical protein